MTALLTDTAALAARYAESRAKAGPDQIGAMLDRLDETVAGLRAQMRIDCPPSLHVDAVTDSRLDLLGFFAKELRGYWTGGTLWADHNTDDPDVDPDAATVPPVYAITGDDLARIRGAEFVRGYDAGYAAADTEPVAIEETV